MTEGTVGPVEAGALLVGAKPPAEIQSAIPDARSAANSGAHRRLSASPWARIRLPNAALQAILSAARVG